MGVLSKLQKLKEVTSPPNVLASWGGLRGTVDMESLEPLGTPLFVTPNIEMFFADDVAFRVGDDYDGASRISKFALKGRRYACAWSRALVPLGGECMTVAMAWV